VEIAFESALLPDGIAAPVSIAIGADGTIERVSAGRPAQGPAPVRGLAVPGMPNLHSHAFQRAMAGAAELRGPGEDSFWTWRDTMYRFVGRLGPEEVEAVAAFVYLEMLEAGYTSVGEFHYVHHQPDGRPYADPAALALAVRAAAERAGIRQVLLPTLYQTAGFGGQQPQPAQRRFVHDTQSFLKLVERMIAAGTREGTTGIALHSLRAVPMDALRETVTAFGALAPRAPIHIHVAEQQPEVEACLAFCGRRPVQYLLESGLVDARWCLVHATHVDAAEISGMAETGAIVGLCPTTEGNLGDGVFPLDALLAAGGKFGVGSDSHVSIDPAEELRAAEYALRLARGRRVIAASAREPNCGTFLYRSAAAGGARALGLSSAGLAVGAPADIVVIDTERAAMAGAATAALIDTHVFAPRPGAVRDVMVGGQWRVRDGKHPQRAAIEAGYRAAIARLTGARTPRG
jgi:formimidoylglutamate deiminase